MDSRLGNGERVILAYFEDITATKSKPLSRAREGELAIRIQQGDMQARDELVQANLRFVVDVAKGYQHRGLPLADLIGAGNLGLLTAAERFDGARGCKFISYAVWWIRQSILQTLAEQTRTVRLPMNKVGLLHHLAKVSEPLWQSTGEEPGVADLAEAVGVSVQEVQETLRVARNVRSLDGITDEGEEHSLLDILPDVNQDPPDTEALRMSDQALTERVLASLDEREGYVLRLYFGLIGSKGMTLEQIGRQIGVTRERVRQIKERGLEKLRHPARSQMLQSLVDNE
jgi:RNA polymerase primary sigma factor